MKILLFLVFLCTVSCQDPHANDSQQIALSKTQVWGFGILTGIGISLMGFLAAIILVLAKKFCNDNIFNNVIKFMFSLAFGALLGDGIIHILSQAFSNSDINAILASLIFIASLLLFIFIDRLLHAYGVAHSHWVPGEHDHSTQHIHQSKHNHEHTQQNHSKKISNQAPNNQIPQYPPNQTTFHPLQNKKPITEQPSLVLANNQIISNQPPIKNPNDIQPQNNQQTTTENQLNLDFKQKIKICCQNLKGKQSKGYMNILGSFIHNFIDGLAIGVTFATGNRQQIISVVVAIIAHQIPRQLGDVAILLKSRFSSIQTILCNGTINFLSLFGVIAGLTAINLNEIVQTYIMVSVAGNFLYIASDIWQNLFKNKGNNAKLHNFMEFVGASVGIGAMVGIKLLDG